MTQPITIETRSPRLGEGEHRLVATLPTFRRPEHLARTLASLAAQTRPVPVIVMENDAERREGLAAARPFFEDGRLQGLVLIAHERGNCSAYNAGWETALAEFGALEHLLVIDDDEIAGPQWAERLAGAADAFAADIVGAPVLPVFEDERGERWRRHPVFSPPYRASGPVPILYGSGNLAIARQVLETMPRPYLDPAFNFIGGGDADFFSRCKLRGFSFAWCQEGALYETTPARRTEFSWVHARGLRNGALSAIIERRRKGRAVSLARSAALLAACPLRAARLGLQTGSAAIGLYPIQVALGRWQGEFGLVHEQYRRPEAH
ncbi:glycosyltransferase family 2 protein [Aureimonas populi]|uniref:Glycosyltransferase family 2 protein n=1 Tax=Aureimonas populi TaxID=1701758 RepID=A0ABW5CHS6_9HYPH|nr:glycosyltransferase [Aureimonas populi]